MDIVLTRPSLHIPSSSAAAAAPLQLAGYRFMHPLFRAKTILPTEGGLLDFPPSRNLDTETIAVGWAALMGEMKRGISRKEQERQKSDTRSSHFIACDTFVTHFPVFD
jgi:hypothetical protein